MTTRVSKRFKQNPHLLARFDKASSHLLYNQEETFSRNEFPIKCTGVINTEQLRTLIKKTNEETHSEKKKARESILKKEKEKGRERASRRNSSSAV